MKNLSFSYGAQAVLKDVSFSAGGGQLVSLLGPNGVGKSTLFRCLLGLLPGFTGEALIGGESARTLSARELSRRIAYIPQSHYPAFHFSVFDMVLMGTTAQVRGFASPGPRQMAKAGEALERLGLARLKAKGYMQISGGERQLVLIARALAQDARVLLMDEPTSNLDYGNRLRVMEETRKLAREGYCILESTHHPDQAFLYADKMVALKDGRVLAEGAPKAILTEALIGALYGVEVRMQSLFHDAVRVCVPSWAIGQPIKPSRQTEGGNPT